MIRSLFVCTAGVAGFASGLAAQARSDSIQPDVPVFRVGAIIVQAARPVATGGGASAIEVQLDSMRLKPAPTLDQVLRELPLVQVRTNPRGEGYFSIRGSGFDAREVAVLADGIPLSLGFDHRADISVLPVSAASTLTVVRGIPSLLFGPNVLGGVVEIGIANTASPAPGVQTAQMSAGIDQTGAYSVGGAVALPQRIGSGNLLVRAGGGHRSTDGFPLPRGVSEPAPFAADNLRLNSDREQRDGFFAARFAAQNGKFVSFSSSGYSTTRGTPAELGGTNPRFWRYPEVRRLFSVASVGTGTSRSPFGGHAEVRASVGFDAGHIELDGFTSRTYMTVQEREQDDDRNISTRILATQSIGSRGDLRTAFTFADVRRDELLTPGAASVYRQRLWSVAGENGWSLPAVAGLSALRVSGGLSYDAGDTPESGDKPRVVELKTWGGRLGFTAVAAGGKLLLHAGSGRRARFPSLRELYSGALKMFEPNPALQPEVLIATEGGATGQIGNAQIQIVGFHHDITDAIVRSVTPAKKVKRINRDEMHSTGLELLGSMRLGPANISADVTAQNIASRDPTTDREFHAEYQPKFLGGARLAAPLVLGTRIDLSTRTAGAQYCLNTSGSYTRLESTTRADAELSRRWHVRAAGSRWFSSIETSVAGDNLGDAAIYDQCGLPQPGRVLRIRITFR
jgi:iron complex outermembrane receptor protein